METSPKKNVTSKQFIGRSFTIQECTSILFSWSLNEWLFYETHCELDDCLSHVWAVIKRHGGLRIMESHTPLSLDVMKDIVFDASGTFY